ncbi:MAG TPA: HAMP domain-containing sensor histidine kinase [Thermoanaerobaculia bacterium]|nr:HAMP domain-containing sensor histidine kinase [Thermoanaerobaculia bacterium]
MSVPVVDRLEPGTEGHVLSERVLVRAPTGEDTALIADVLREAGREVVPLDDLSALAREWESGAGTLVIASETLNAPDCCTSLRELLDAQEPWSEIPVVLLGGGGEDEEPLVAELLGDRAQLLVLERPLGIATFVSAIESALRSRRRQYEVKRLLDQLAASAVSIARAHEQADRAKDEFLATLAHELRSPMTAIRGWIQMLQLGELSATEATEALSMIDASTRVQAHIVEDLMDVSRILAGKIMIDPALIPLAPVVTNVAATFRPAAALNGIHLVASITEEPIFVFADDARLQQVGWNLLSNAIKFTPRGGSVHVSLTREPPNAVFRIRDTGEGISPELLPHVFDRYRQEEGKGGKAHQGLGLGLAIVRYLVERHGGSVCALSEGRGKGAEFVVTLPLREA